MIKYVICAAFMLCSNEIISTIALSVAGIMFLCDIAREFEERGSV